MAINKHIKMIEATFKHFGTLANWHDDPDGLEAVRTVKSQMVDDLMKLNQPPTKNDISKLCSSWRQQRLEPTGEAEYPEDMFIESICQVIELA